MEQSWEPKPSVLACLGKEAEENLSGRLIVHGKSLTWADVLEEVRRGTPFGKKYHDALFESLKAAR
jgi:hypothetical protein